MMKYKSTWLVLTAFSIIFCAEAQENSFDVICEIVINAEKNKAFMSLPVIEKSNYLVTKIEEKVAPSSAAYRTYSVIAQADPSLKYKLFKEAAELELSRKWECSALDRMNTLMINEQSNSNKKPFPLKK